jgi:hypothetical protein
MLSSINRLLFWLWPPYEAWLTEKKINKKHRDSDDKTRWKSILEKARASLQGVDEGDDINGIEALAKQIQDSEAKRKEILENKASSFISSFTIALSIFSLAAALFTDKQTPKICAIFLGCIYLLAIIHWFAATYYAVKTRRVVGFAAFNADKFMDVVQKNQWKAKERIVFAISEAKWNEDLLRQKSNCLDVSEKLFVHGLFLVLCAVIAGVAIKVLEALACLSLP